MMEQRPLVNIPQTNNTLQEFTYQAIRLLVKEQ